MVDGKQKKKMIVSIIGIGRVGLPLSLVVANEGYTVFGIGRSIAKVDKINKGEMPFKEENAPALLQKHVKKNFFATVDYSHIKKSDIIILTLGTPVDENMNPVFDQINETIDKALPFFKKGQILILRSTVSPRTTKYVQSLIEDKSELVIGKNFFLAFCPERISEGSAIEEIKSIPQIIGTDDAKSSKLANEFFISLGVTTVLTDTTSAELGKLFTNMYRYINFAIANEFMVLAQNYHKDIYEIVNLVNYKYKRGGLSLPGFSAGPCLVKDGFFLVSDLPFSDLISTSWRINEGIPNFLVKLIRERVKLSGKKIALLGLGFKAESDDVRSSLSFKTLKTLLRERANVVLHDPYVREYANQKVERDVYRAIEGADVIFIGTNHKEYKKLNIKKVKQLAKKNCIICDVWNVFETSKIVYKLNKMDE